jgi:GNAT superfamily N-acetyltransferase
VVAWAAVVVLRFAPNSGSPPKLIRVEAPLAIPDAVRRLAEHPILELPISPSLERIEQAGVVIVVTPFPIAQMIEPVDLALDDVESAVRATRAIGRERGKTVLGWWILPEHDAYVSHLETLGLVNDDSAGFEAIENAMALVTPPQVALGEGVEVKQVESFDEFTGAAHVAMEAFQMPTHVRDEMQAGFATRFEEYLDPRNPGKDFIALIDGRIVGAATAIAADAGVNLFGGSVLPEARGRGVYQALLRARWDFAVERGTPALTVQAGRMSKPIVERLGFVQLAAARLFFDNL